MVDDTVKVGIVADDIRDHIGRYSKNFITLPIGETGVKKYGLLIRGSSPSDTIMLMISKRDEIYRTPDGDSFNVMITVSSKDRKKALEILEDFEKKMPFKLRKASEFVKKREQFFSKLIEEYLKKI